MVIGGPGEFLRNVTLSPINVWIFGQVLQRPVVRPPEPLFQRTDPANTESLLWGES